MVTPIDDSIWEEFSRDFDDLANDDQKIQIEISKIEAFTLVGQLQLALRHSANVGPGSEIAKQFALKLQAAVANTPVLHEVISRGWHKEFDI